MMKLGVEFKDGQGLGNQLWCYASTRSIAEHLGLEFATLGIDKFKGKEFLSIETGSCVDQALLDVTHPWRIRKEKLYYDKRLDYIGSTFDRSLLDIDCDTIIEGLMQNERYLKFAHTSIDEMIRIADGILDAKGEKEGPGCVINIRGGEYKRHKRFILPKSYWTNAIANMKSRVGVDRFTIVTDDSAYARDLLPEYPIVSGDIGNCYLTIRSARYCIVSNSTFSYFPIKTGTKAEFVIAPKYWGRFNDSSCRWASTANLYEDWSYQDQDGNLWDYTECAAEVKVLEEEYMNYNIGVPSIVERENRYKQLVPSVIKKPVKDMLRLINPVAY